MIEDEEIINKEESIFTELGENFQYVKTIFGNKIEITKLEFLQKISNMASLMILSFIGVFAVMIVFAMFIGIMVVYLAQVFGSYVTALLISSGLVIIICLLVYFLGRTIIKSFLEKKMIEIIK